MFLAGHLPSLQGVYIDVIIAKDVRGNCFIVLEANRYPGSNDWNSSIGNINELQEKFNWTLLEQNKLGI